MDVKKGYGYSDPYVTLYRVHWVEANEEQKSSIKGPKAAFKHMERLLARGIPSWMTPVPPEEDDLPF